MSSCHRSASRSRTHHDRDLEIQPREAGTPARSAGNACVTRAIRQLEKLPGSPMRASLAVQRSGCRGQSAASRRPECPDGPPAKDPAPFNAHSPGGAGRGLAQHVLRSPARTPAEGSPLKVPCAAPANVKRCTLVGAIPHGNDAMRLAARRPDQHHAASIQVPRGDEAVLAIGVALVLDRDGAAGEHRSRVGEIQATVVTLLL